MREKIEVSPEVASILINGVCQCREDLIDLMHVAIRMINAEENQSNGICNYILGNVHGMYTLLLKLGAIDHDEYNQLFEESVEKFTPENVFEELERMESLKA